MAFNALFGEYTAGDPRYATDLYYATRGLQLRLWANNGRNAQCRPDSFHEAGTGRKPRSAQHQRIRLA